MGDTEDRMRRERAYRGHGLRSAEQKCREPGGGAKTDRTKNSARNHETQLAVTWKPTLGVECIGGKVQHTVARANDSVGQHPHP